MNEWSYFFEKQIIGWAVWLKFTAYIGFKPSESFKTSIPACFIASIPDWKKAVASGDEEKSQSYKTTENAYYSANSKDPSIKELDSALNDLLTNDPYISNQLQKVNNLIALGNIEAPAVGPQYKRFLSSKKERKQEKERKQKIKDEGYEGAGFLPMDFKEGGRSKLIWR